MIRKKMYNQIQAFKQQGHSKKEIATALGMESKIVAKYYSMEERDSESNLNGQFFNMPKVVVLMPRLIVILMYQSQLFMDGKEPLKKRERQV